MGNDLQNRQQVEALADADLPLQNLADRLAIGRVVDQPLRWFRKKEDIVVGFSTDAGAHVLTIRRPFWEMSETIDATEAEALFMHAAAGIGMPVAEPLRNSRSGELVHPMKVGAQVCAGMVSRFIDGVQLHESDPVDERSATLVGRSLGEIHRYLYETAGISHTANGHDLAIIEDLPQGAAGRDARLNPLYSRMRAAAQEIVERFGEASLHVGPGDLPGNTIIGADRAYFIDPGYFAPRHLGGEAVRYWLQHQPRVHDPRTPEIVANFVEEYGEACGGVGELRRAIPLIQVRTFFEDWMEAVVTGQPGDELYEMAIDDGEFWCDDPEMLIDSGLELLDNASTTSELSVSSQYVDFARQALAEVAGLGVDDPSSGGVEVESEDGPDVAHLSGSWTASSEESFPPEIDDESLCTLDSAEGRRSRTLDVPEEARPPTLEEIRQREQMSAPEMDGRPSRRKDRGIGC